MRPPRCSPFPMCICRRVQTLSHTAAVKPSAGRNAQALYLEKEYTDVCLAASSPHHGPGRDNKVGREEMMGMLAAVEAWTKRDHAAEWKTWLGYL